MNIIKTLENQLTQLSTEVIRFYNFVNDKNLDRSKFVKEYINQKKEAMQRFIKAAQRKTNIKKLQT